MDDQITEQVERAAIMEQHLASIKAQLAQTTGLVRAKVWTMRLFVALDGNLFLLIHLTLRKVKRRTKNTCEISTCVRLENSKRCIDNQ
jgi:dolichyl-phosphate-mannose--protein O-mannosyl transferase